MPTSKGKSIVSIVIASTLLMLQAQSISHAQDSVERVWKDTNGRSIQGSLVRFWFERNLVVIRQGGSKYVRVPLEALSFADQDYVKAEVLTRVWRSSRGKHKQKGMLVSATDTHVTLTLPNEKSIQVLIEKLSELDRKFIDEVRGTSLLRAVPDPTAGKGGELALPSVDADSLPMQPYGELAWDDDLLTAITKLQEVKNVDVIALKTPYGFWFQKVKTHKLHADAAPAALGRAFEKLNTTQLSFLDFLEKKVHSLKSGTSIARLIASPIETNLGDFELLLTFQYHWGHALLYPSHAEKQAKQLFGEDSDLYFPMFLSEVVLSLKSSPLKAEEVYKQLIQTLNRDYARYEYRAQGDYLHKANKPAALGYRPIFNHVFVLEPGDDYRLLQIGGTGREGLVFRSRNVGSPGVVYRGGIDAMCDDILRPALQRQADMAKKRSFEELKDRDNPDL